MKLNYCNRYQNTHFLCQQDLAFITATTKYFLPSTKKCLIQWFDKIQIYAYTNRLGPIGCLHNVTSTGLPCLLDLCRIVASQELRSAR